MLKGIKIGNLDLGNSKYWMFVKMGWGQITNEVPGIKLAPIAIITLDIV